MNKTYLLILTALLLTSNTFAQSKPLIYFCEKYDTGKEIGISDKFPAGYFTIILRSKNEFGVDSVYIQTDKYNTKSKTVRELQQIILSCKPAGIKINRKNKIKIYC